MKQQSRNCPIILKLYSIKLDDFQCFIGRTNLKSRNENNSKQQEIVDIPYHVAIPRQIFRFLIGKSQK